MTEMLETAVRNSDHLDIPQKIKESLHIREGDRILWIYEGDRLVAEVKKKGNWPRLWENLAEKRRTP
jgi:antitoxin component of MazEF toxin-antitoxin module